MNKNNEKYFVSRNLKNNIMLPTWWVTLQLPYRPVGELKNQVKINSYKNAVLIDQIHEVYWNLWEARFLLKSIDEETFSQIKDPEHEFSVIIAKHTFLKHALVSYFSCLELFMKFLFLDDYLTNDVAEKYIKSEERKNCAEKDFEERKRIYFGKVKPFQDRLNDEDKNYKYLKQLYNYYKHSGFIDFGIKEASGHISTKIIKLALFGRNDVVSVKDESYVPHRIESYERCVNALINYHNIFLDFVSEEIEQRLPTIIISSAKESVEK